MRRLGGKEVADEIIEELKVKVSELKGKGVTPKLAILRVGNRDDDLAYERGVLKRVEPTGVEVEVTALDAEVTQGELDEVFDSINNDPKVHGILVFRPLPKGLSDEHMRRTIDSGKDVDFMDTRNMEGVLAGVPDCSAPCTAEAVMALIKHYGIETRGKKVTVVGRSLVIGKPVALLLTTANATVTVCHTKTQSIEEECKNADIIVACIGENSYCETPGNLTDLILSENQRNLVKALSKTGKPIVLIINGGRPRIIADIEPLANAVVDILLPGNYGADALANLLAGDANFSAKMPYTYPKEINSLINYDFKVSEQVNTMAGAYDYDAKVVQQWGFGYGLSYTTYAYSKLSADKVDFKDGDEITFSVDVTNTGRVAGKEPVLLYSSDLVASIVPDSRRLRAFTKVALEPGETKTVSLTIKASDLAFVGADGKWILEEGDFNIQVGDQAVTVSCTETKKYENPNK